jgi:hypothetical protein
MAGRRSLLVLGALAVASVATLTFAEHTVADLDVWGAMAMGRETLSRGWPPAQDPFTYVPTRNPLVYHEWLSGALFYLVLEHLGDPALKVLTIGLALLAVGLAALAGRRLGASRLSLLLVILTALPSLQQGYNVIRAQAFTFAFFALFVLLLEEAARGRRRGLLLIPAVMVVWANLHGGFVAGIGALALYVVSHLLRGERPWLLIGVSVVAVVGTLLNPYGPSYWQYLHEAILMPRPRIGEWAPLPLDLTSRWAFKGGLLLSALAVIVASRRHWPGIIVMGITAVLAVRHVRHIPFFAVALIAFLPFHLTPLLDRVGEFLRARVPVRPALPVLFTCFVLVLLTVGAVFQLTLAPWRVHVPASIYPVGAVEFLRLNGLAGNLATPFNWGQYVIWKLGPQVKVSFDGRYETVYPPHVSTDNFNFMYGEGDWRRLLRVYPTEMVLVHREYPMAGLMEKEPGWSVVYQDAISALYLPAGRGGGPWRFPPTSDGTIP